MLESKYETFMVSLQRRFSGNVKSRPPIFKGHKRFCLSVLPLYFLSSAFFRERLLYDSNWMDDTGRKLKTGNRPQKKNQKYDTLCTSIFFSTCLVCTVCKSKLNFANLCQNHRSKELCEIFTYAADFLN